MCLDSIDYGGEQMNENPFIMTFFVRGGYYAQSHFLQSTSLLESNY